jgi:hypothetical protein
MVAVQSIAMLTLRPTWLAGLLVVASIVLNLAFFRVDRKRPDSYGHRLLWLALHVLLASFFTAPHWGMEFSLWFIDIVRQISTTLPLLSSAVSFAFGPGGILLLGFLLVLEESNLVIRYCLGVARIAVPRRDQVPDDRFVIGPGTYNAGRMIGILERILILIFVIVGEYTAIAFIIAAKGFARFKDLDKREFAEYVLVGTLLSSVVAVLVGLLARVGVP